MSNLADRIAGDRVRVLFLCTHNSARSQMDRLHWSFLDPSRVEGEGRLAAFPRARDEIRARIEGELIGATKSR